LQHSERHSAGELEGDLPTGNFLYNSLGDGMGREVRMAPVDIYEATRDILTQENYRGNNETGSGQRIGEVSSPEMGQDMNCRTTGVEFSRGRPGENSSSEAMQDQVEAPVDEDRHTHKRKRRRKNNLGPNLCLEDKSYNCFFSNVTSWGPQAEGYIFNRRFTKHYNVVGLAEHHRSKTLDLDFKAKFSSRGYRLTPNPAQATGRSETGTHGGEAVSVHKHLDSKPIAPDVLEAIEQEFGEPLHFAAVMLRLKHKTVLVASMYMWAGQGTSDENHVILQQLHSLSEVLKLPFICVGDF